MHTITRDPELVVVSVDGAGASWSPTAGWQGDAELKRRAKIAAAIGEEVAVGRLVIEASDEDAIGAVAALSASNPDRTVIAALPEDARRILAEAPPMCTADYDTHSDSEEN
jgi:hypothetical protein